MGHGAGVDRPRVLDDLLSRLVAEFHLLSAILEQSLLRAWPHGCHALCLLQRSANCGGGSLHLLMQDMRKFEHI